jgi:hypothetical protein
LIDQAEMIWGEARTLGVAKWNRGQVEHGGDLTRKPVLDEAVNEALDQVSYLLVLRRQVVMAKLLLSDALSTGDMGSVRSALHLLQFGNAEAQVYE